MASTDLTNENVTASSDRELEKMFFLKSIKSLENRSVLLRRIEGGYEVANMTRELAAMMECESVEEATRLMDGSGFFDTTHPDDQMMVKRMFRRRKAKDGSNDLIIRKITAKGNTIWCNVHYAFIDDFDEHYIYATYFDVTIMKEYENRLHTSYKGILDRFYKNVDKSFCLFRINLGLDRVEDMQGSSLFGTDSLAEPFSKVLEHRMENYPIKREQEEILATFMPAALTEMYSQGQTKCSRMAFSKRRDGTLCFVKIEAHLTRHPLSGDLIAFIKETVSNDKKVNETLISKILARQFDMVCFIANGEYGVVVGDASLITKGSIFPLTMEGDYTEWLENRVVPVLYGSDEEQDAMADALEIEKIEEELLAGNEPYIVNICCKIDGKIYYKRCDYFTIDPEANFFVMLKSDTTDIQRKQIERNEQLRLALREAESASVAKTAFLSRMSHEIRTPMNAIIGLDKIALQEKDLSTGMKDHLEKIGESANYLLSLINDILDMSRIESGRVTVENEEFSINSFLEQVNSMIESQCGQKDVGYSCQIKGELNDYYIGDETKLKQVLINLLGNSVKFTEAGGSITLFVSRLSMVADHAMLRFEIKDTGIGMDQAFLDRIYEPFSQEDDTNTSKYEGTGLGLAITKNIVEMMNGQITVHSEKGVGTTFTVTLPLGISGRTVDPSEPEKEADGGKEISLEGRRILLAEDMIINAEIIKQLLSMQGMETDHAENGQIVVDIFSGKPEGYYDAVLMDVRMPVLDGLGAAKAIRELDREDAKRIPIIALTANAFEEDVQRSLQAGMNAHLSKPVDPEVLFGILRELIAQAGE